MKLARFAAPLAVLVALVSLPTLAQAQPSNAGAPNEARDNAARVLYEDGRSAFDRGEYEEAMRLFQEAYRLSGRALLLYNIGQVADRLQQEDLALRSFEEFLERAPDAANRTEVEARVRVLRAAIERNRAREAEREAAEAARLAEAERRRAPTPAEVAEASETHEPPASAPLAPRHDEEEEADSGGITSQWWFWTGVVLVVAGGVTAAVVLTREEEVAPLRPGQFGVGGVIYTLESR